ncbi:hypothetical protein O7606_14925 [Micromonospora sp. WMMD882]|uniref:hypothetical protein n=1 Tax=Micromonospora sp. WMMD882 TaxID=3015151 RepID=UPI00248B3014|nr:hypothetical protein [Micromonospora sp. WMMD882]WBB77575.1 hypothetical protein O7606_14925 [Micromonospora sp. WMMD882]
MSTSSPPPPAEHRAPSGPGGPDAPERPSVTVQRTGSGLPTAGAAGTPPTSPTTTGGTPSTSPTTTGGTPSTSPTTTGGTPSTDATVLTAAGGIEPTTGAPVADLPRRAPIRQHRAPLQPEPGVESDAGDDDFWLPIEEVHWDGTPIRPEPSRRAGRLAGWLRRRLRRDRRARVTRQRAPLPGLAALLGLSLLTAFFAWVSAEPFWLAVGHGVTGTVVLDECAGDGLTQRCRGVFVADHGRFVAHGVRVSGVDSERRAPGTPSPARMTGPHGATAYVGSGGGGHLRWLLGFGLVLACAAGVRRATGTAGLTDRRARRWATAVAFAAPLALLLGFLVAAF